MVVKLYPVGDLRYRQLCLKEVIPHIVISTIVVKEQPRHRTRACICSSLVMLLVGPFVCNFLRQIDHLFVFVSASLFHFLRSMIRFLVSPQLRSALRYCVQWLGVIEADSE